MLADDEYRNWMEVGQALLFLSEIVKYHASKEIKALYEDLTRKIGSQAKCNCTCGLGKHDLHNCKWAQAILSYHRNPSKVVWTASDSSKWDDPVLGPWEIASVYINQHSVDGVKYLQFLRFCSFSNASETIVMDIIDVWEKLWGTTPNRRLEHDEKLYALDSITKFLHESLFRNDPNTKRILKDIQSLEYWDSTRLQLCEVQVSRTYQEMLEKKRLQIMKGIVNLETNLNNVESLLADVQGSSQRISFPLQGSFTLLFTFFAVHLFSFLRSMFFHRFCAVLGLIISFVLLGSLTMVFALVTSKYVTMRI